MLTVTADGATVYDIQFRHLKKLSGGDHTGRCDVAVVAYRWTRWHFLPNSLGALALHVERPQSIQGNTASAHIWRSSNRKKFAQTDWVDCRSEQQNSFLLSVYFFDWQICCDVFLWEYVSTKRGIHSLNPSPVTWMNKWCLYMKTVQKLKQKKVQKVEKRQKL